MAISKVIPALIDSTGATTNQVIQFNGSSVAWVTPASGTTWQNTQTANTTTTTGAWNFIFPFIIGQCYIEYLDSNVTNGNTAKVVAAGWVNMRSYSGTKNANITDRLSQMCGISATPGIAYFKCQRSNSGLTLTVTRIVTTSAQATGYIDTGVGLFSYVDENWKTSYSLRVTAYEDIQS